MFHHLATLVTICYQTLHAMHQAILTMQPHHHELTPQMRLKYKTLQAIKANPPRI